MTELPRTANPLVVRTDVASDAAWADLRRVLATPNEDGFRAYVDLVDDDRFAGLTATDALARLPAGYEHPFVVLADAVALAAAELPLLVIDLAEERGRCIRVVATELWGLENNLSIANMDFGEFAAAVDPDGVFRGY